MAFVALVVPCHGEVLRPSDRAHARRVLEALGDEVLEIRGLCCGQPAYNSGHRSEARAVGRSLLREARHFEAVVMPSGSCVSMVRHHLPTLYEGGRRDVAQRIGNTFSDLAEYIATHPASASLRFRLEGTVAYHDSCHARRELGLTTTVLDLLGRVEGLEVRRLRFEAECCGFGGTFSVKQPESSSAIREAKLADVVDSGARVLVSTDLSCLSHVASGARAAGVPLETWTVAELLSRALP